jgi:proteasome alpha subunit
VLKERYSPGMSIEAALGAAIAALSGQGNGERTEINGSQLEVAVLARGRAHRTFRRIRGAQLEQLLGQAQSGSKPAGGKGTKSAAADGAGEDAAGEPSPGDGTAP